MKRLQTVLERVLEQTQRCVYQIIVSIKIVCLSLCLSLSLSKNRHCANMSMQYTAISNNCKNDNFSMKLFIFSLIYIQNTNCGENINIRLPSWTPSCDTISELYNNSNYFYKTHLLNAVYVSVFHG